MFDQLEKVRAGVLVILGLLLSFSLVAQEFNREEGPSPGAATEAFERGDYSQALEGFTALMDGGMDDVMMSYYRGRCLLALNRDIPEAIEFLFRAAEHNGPDDSRYYLAEAYRKDYNFREAIRQYSEFDRSASRSLLRDLDVEHQIANCRSALQICSSYNPYEVMMVAFMDLADSTEYSQISMKGGRLRPVSEILPGEGGEGLAALAFIPRRPARGDYIYFVSGSSADKHGTQLYRSRRGSGRWGNPEALDDLNTDGDELLPYFDPIGKDLYFASRGREGVGDFDLYRSHYDSERDQWSEAINLGFPINSAMDDYLLLPGNDLGMMMFFSNREGTDSTLTVYRVHMVEPKKQADTGDNEMLKEIASLGGAARAVLDEYKSLMAPQEIPQEALASEAPRYEGQAGPGYTKVRILDGGEEPVDIILAEALKYQARSDSLKDLAMEARIRIRESEDPNDRWVWQKQIMLWERRAVEEEDRADFLYAESGKAMDRERSAAVNVPEKVEARDRIVPVIPAAPPAGEPGYQPPVVEEVPVGEPETINRFQVLERPPYSDSNPVPLGVTLPDGVFYRIQIGVFGNPVAPDHFRGISPITAENMEDRGLVKYYAGKFSRYSDASAALERVRSLGYEDAFLAAWYNGSAVPTQRARQLE